MSSFARFGFAALAVFLAFSAAPPSSRAQTRSFPYVIQMNSTGAYLGIQMDDVTSTNMSRYKLSSEKGVIVRSVQKGSPAEDAKIQADDVILDYAGTPVWSSAQFSRLVEETPPGRKVDLVVSRDGKRVNLTATIGTRSDRAASSDRNLFPRDFMDRIFPFQPPGDRGDEGSTVQTRRPRLGVTLQPLTDQLGEFLGVPGKKGALVSSVLEGSPSAGKLKSGDVIIAADGKQISEPDDLIQLINNKSAGSLNLKVIRDKKEVSVVVNLPALPAEDSGKGGLKL